MTEFNVNIYAKRIHYDSKKHQFRSGQYLFHALPTDASEAVRGKLFDPFYQDMDLESITKWVENHLVLDSGGATVIAVFDGNEVLWEKEALDG
jgi:hypothetical protein